MVISKYNVLTILIILVFVPYMLQEPWFLGNGRAYVGLAPLLATGLLYLPFGFGIRKPNKLSETSILFSLFALLLGFAFPGLVITMMFLAKSTVLGPSLSQPFYYIAIILSCLAMIYQVGAYFRKK